MTNITITVPDDFEAQLALKYTDNAEVWAQRVVNMAVPGVQQDAQALTNWAYREKTGSVPMGNLDDLITAGLSNAIVQTAQQWEANGYVCYAATFVPNPITAMMNAMANSIANSMGNSTGG
jgi:hypothetical protein